jgi:ATP-dependent helicase/nuclease subunit A
MLPHTLITASAGSGKTWSLTVRYLRLLMMGAEPESIVALTFSRKAAGEFFNAILHRLAEAASRSDLAEGLARDIDQPGTTKEEFCHALVKMTARLPFLMLGTLDSFFIRMARSFPFELGLSGDFTLLDPHQQAVEQLRVYERVFAPDAGPATARREFMQAFAEATHGKDEVNVRRKLDEFIKVWHGLFLTAPHAEQWGDARVIWPEQAPVPGPAVERGAVVERIRKGLAGMEMTEHHQDRWTKFLAAVLEYSAGAPMDQHLKYLWDRLQPLKEELRQGGAEVKLDRKLYPLAGPLAEAVADLLEWMQARELEAVLRQTRGIFEVVLRYDRHYHELVRRQGQLTFQDVQLILGGGLSPEASGAMASQARALTHGENRQLMDYRMDSRYDHWLLDEFQDTSRVQWRVLANLIDETVQDGEGRKSFFAVGDQKQSIYEWRGGTPQLFGDIERQYNSGAASEEEKPIRIQPLSLSQRSGPAVIEMVNRLLGDPEALAEVLPAAAVAQWPWQEHTSRNTQFGGTALVLEVPDDPADGNAASSSDDETTEAEEVPLGDARWSRAAEWLKEMQPLKRGLTCAVICHRNPRALAIADFLRSATGMEVVCESDLSVAGDNPATSALLALLQAAAHPGDRFAWQQVMMTPLEAVMSREFKIREGAAAERAQQVRYPVLRQVLAQVAGEGFHDTLRWWITALQRQMPELDGFSLSRMEELCSCARQFDSSGSRDVDEFLTFAAAWTVRGTGHTGAVQVMTVHRSKGLTFDIVLIPDLHDQMFRYGQTVGMKLDAGGGVEWLLKLPKKNLTESDPVLGSAMARATAANWRERMAGLYVMVTRARYANYLFLKPPPRTTSTPSLARVVRQTLTQEGAGNFPIQGKSYSIIATFGDPDWFLAHELKQPVKASAPVRTRDAKPAMVQEDLFASPPAVSLASLRKRIPLRAKRPSGMAIAESSGNFQSARQAAREAGLAVHEALRRVKWAEDAGQALAAPGLEPEAVAEARTCLRDPGLAEFFANPGPTATLWRERAFDVILNGVLHSGVFDRVIVHRDAAGRPQAAVLIDFKTEFPTPTASEAAEQHRPQLEIYREALCHLLRLPPEKIRRVVVFTGTRQALEL